MRQITPCGKSVGRFSMLQFCYSFPSRVGAVAEMVADAVGGVCGFRLTVRRAPSVRPWSLLAVAIRAALPPCRRGRSVGVSYVALFRRFRGFCAVGGVFVRAWRLSGLYGRFLAPCAVLRSRSRCRLPLSRDFSPLLARFAVGHIGEYPQKEKAALRAFFALSRFSLSR